MGDEYTVVLPVHAREGEVVDVHWRLKDGSIFVQRYTCPPKETRDVRRKKNLDSNTPPDRPSVGSDVPNGGAV